MADDFDQESRTEAPTQRRREDAYDKGQFAISTELTSGIIVFVGVGTLAVLAHTMGAGFLDQARSALTSMPTRELPVERVSTLFHGMAGQSLLIGGVLLGLLFAAALAVNLTQVGFRLNTDRLSIDWERVSPFAFSRLLSWSKVVRGLVLMVKVAAVAAVAWWILGNRGNEIGRVGDASLTSALARSWDVVIRLALGMAGALFAIGALDYGYQLWQFERSLYMTKQELKEELKREDGDPQIKARVRKMQREIAQRKMLTEVPKATVVITNPTHLAVALRYDAGTMTAPKVIAKGAGHVAKRIVALARQHGVPVMERKSLAQVLFKTVKVDREVPLGLYLVVAELLAYVYRQRAGASPASA